MLLKLVVPQNLPSHFIKISLHKTLWTPDRIRVCSAQDISLHWWPGIRVWVCTGIFGLLMPHVTFILHVGLLKFPIPSFKLWIKFLPSQLYNWPKKSTVLGKKSTMANLQSNSIIFNHNNTLDSYVSFDQVWIIIPQEIWSNLQKGKMVKIMQLGSWDHALN